VCHLCANSDACPLARQRPLKAQLTAEVAAAGSEGAADQIRVMFDKKEKALENEIDHRPLESALPLRRPPHRRPAHTPACLLTHPPACAVHMEMEVHYNVSAAALALARRTRTRPPHSHSPTCPPCA